MRKALFALVVVSAACGSDSSSSGPDYPAIAGTYSVNFTLAFANSIESEQVAIPGTVTITAPDNAGDFGASFIMNGTSGSTSGAWTGTVRMDGGITVHGSGPDFNTRLALTNTFDWCNFSLASYGQTSGAVSGSVLNLTTTIIVPCSYTNPARTVTSTITFTVNGSR